MAGIANPRASVPKSKCILVEKEELVPSVNTTTWAYHTLAANPHPLRVKVGGTQPTAYFSMAATCRVSILPLVWSVEDILPPNRRPALAIFSKTSLTSSPRYRPLIIFSNLQFGEQISGKNAFGYAASFPKAHEPRWLVGGPLHGSGGLGPHPSLGWPVWATRSSPIKGKD